MGSCEPPIAVTVFVVDDDAGVRDSLRWLLESVHFGVETFPSAEAFLASHAEDRPGCLLLDVRMPGMGGARLMDRLIASGKTIPIIFLSEHIDLPFVVQAVKAGAVDFLQKPCNHHQLLEKVRGALDLDAERRALKSRRSDVDERLATLTTREREVLDMVIAGLSNKMIARKLDISPKTVETHRGRVMHKLCAQSVAELVQMVMQH
jgi:FixJ family two-component response regulator